MAITWVLVGLIVLLAGCQTDPPVDNEALVNFENPVYNFKFGVSYTSGGY